MESHDKTSVEHDIGKPMVFSQVFTGADSFDAVNAAEKWLTKHGYSYGVMQQNAPIGIAKNTGRIAKWYNLGSDVRKLDGAMVSDDFRDGSVTVYLDRTPRGAGGHTPRAEHVHAHRAPRKPSGRTTLAMAKKDLAALGMSLRKSDGEYRVTFRGAKPGRAEEVAHYTDSIEDAVATGRAMSKERSKV